MQEKLRAKGKKLYFAFMDLEKAFDRVSREVIRWATVTFVFSFLFQSFSLMAGCVIAASDIFVRLPSDQ